MAYKLRKKDISSNKSVPRLRIAVKLKNLPPDKELRGLEGLGNLVFRLLPLIDSLDPKQFNELRERALEMMEKARQMIDKTLRTDPQTKLPDFSYWHQIICPKELPPDDLVRALRKSELVETAYVMRPVPPPFPPPVNGANRDPNQGYLDPAPDGIDALYAWSKGGDGDGIRFVDMEQGWNLEHEDLAAARITLISGVNHDYFWHGTSALGEVLMDDNNTVGGVGIAPRARAAVVSQWRKDGSYDYKDPDSFNTASAIFSALDNMKFGDVLLLEAQEDAELGSEPGNNVPGPWPVEIADGTYAALEWAKALGIVVIEAAGNGAHDLENSSQTSSGKKIFDQNSPDFRDSGAIMVGAASSASPHARLLFSNYGKRIDCYAWGENIETTDSNDAGNDSTAYRPDFDGTSGASPIIAGAALIIQGLAKASPLGRPFFPQELRRILTNGTFSENSSPQNPNADGIGVMPNLQAIIDANRLARV